MALQPTFADTFKPRVRSQALPALSVPLLPSFGTAAGLGHEMRLTREQARHCRLWNYIAIDANATKAAEDIPHVGYVAADGSRLPDPHHPLAQLFRDVNPVDWWQSFAHEMYLMWGLFRRVVVWMNPNGFGLPAELWVIPTTWAEPVVDRAGNITCWRITPGCGGPGGDASPVGGAFEIDADEILCAQAKHPASKAVPLSPTEAGAEWIVSSEIIERARTQTYENGPLQSMLLEIDPEHHQSLTPELLDAIGEKFMARYQGWNKAGRPIVQPPGVKAVPWSVKPSEMLTGEQADQLRDNVLALHKTPRSAVGISSDLNRASIWGAEHNWYEHALNPMRRFLAGALTEFLASRFEAGLVVWYDDLIPRDKEDERAEIELDFKLGAITPDERRRARGYEPLGIRESQTPYRSSSMVPLDTPVQPAAMPGTGTSKEPQTPAERDDGAAGEGDDDDDPAGPESDFSGGASAIDEKAERGGFAVRQTRGCPTHGAPRRQAVDAEADTFAGPDSGEADPGDDVDPAAEALASDFGRSHAAASELLARGATEFFRQLAREVGARIDAGALVDTDVCPDAIVRAGFNSALTPGWRKAAELGVEFERRALAPRGIADRIAQAARGSKRPAGGRKPANPPQLQRSIDEWVASQQAGAWKQIAKSTRREIGAVIGEGIAEGVSLRTLKRRVQKVITQPSRAAAIAETEATGGVNQGAQLLRSHEGVTEKQWHTTGGPNSRPSHAAARGQVAQNDGEFVVGGYRMKYPGDTSSGAPASEVARCRCFASGRVEAARPAAPKPRRPPITDDRGMTVYPDGATLKNWLGDSVEIPPGHTMSLRDPPMDARPMIRQGGLSDSRGFTDAERTGFLAGHDGGTYVTPHHRHQIAVRDGGVLDELPRFGHPEGNVHLSGRPTRHPNDGRGGRNGTVFDGPGGEKLHRDEVTKFFQDKGRRLVHDSTTGLWLDPLAQ